MDNGAHSDARKERGRALAKDKRIKHVHGAMWMVPSQSQNSGAYLVNMEAATCTCPDFEERRQTCKHAWAVTFVQTVEVAADGSAVVTETLTVRKTYKQDWPSYNAAQCSEKAAALALLRDLCDGIVTPAHPGRGPKPIPLSDTTFAMVLKVYTGMSARRATTDIEACGDMGHMTRVPSYNAVLAAFEREDMIPLLTALVEQSAAPLAAIETKFAIDSTGFSSCVHRRWFDAKYNREMSEATWLKAHAMVGTVTNVITAVRITDGYTNDGPQLPALVDSTANRFDVREVSADKAYLSNANLTAIESVGATPYVPFKLNSRSEGSEAWRRMWGLFTYRQRDFLRAYNQRSNSESTFSALKRKFGGSVRSKHFTAQTNEILAKCLCFNLSMLVHAMHELGIDPDFRSEQAQ
jgi:transposase